MKKAQISVEYAILIGLIVFALALTVAIAMFYGSSAKGQITLNQIDKVGKKIAETADSVYYLGYPSKATIDLIMPEGIEEIEVTNSQNSHFIKFKFRSSSGYSYAIYTTRAELNTNDQDIKLNSSRFKSAGVKQLIINVTETGIIDFFPTTSL